MSMKRKGMTLTSVLVAVALTSALAVATSKLISNQSKLNKIMELTDQRDMITRFYSALMHNRIVWRCTIYDPNNSALLDYISNTTNSFSDKVELRTPDCKFEEEFTTTGTAAGIKELRPLTAPHSSGNHYRSSGAFFDTNNPMLLGKSITEHTSDGWWNAALTANSINKGSVDLTLTITFDRTKYKAAHGDFEPPDIRDTVEYKVRKGDPNVENMLEDCNTSAVVAIGDLASGLREVTCSSDFGIQLVNVPNVGTGQQGNFLHTLADGSDARVGGDRTGLKIENVLPHAIENITTSGDYQLTPVNGAAGVLAFPAGSAPCSNNEPVLTAISAGSGVWDNHKGPQGVQGLPGPPGRWGPQGPPGYPAPACGS